MTLKQHENKYIHINKKWLFIFAPLCVVVPFVYWGWIIFQFVMTIFVHFCISIMAPFIPELRKDYFSFDKEMFQQFGTWFMVVDWKVKK